MASHFKWYPAESEVVVPFNARYSFPSQSNKAMKMTPRIPPKNAASFSPGNVIRLEFPAQGYVNPGKTTLEFDVEMVYAASDAETSYVRFQNNIQSIFNRVRLLYGATPIEDIPYYNVIVRSLTEWTGTNNEFNVDQTSIAEGIGGICQASNFIQDTVGTSVITNTFNTRQKHIHGIDFTGRYAITGGPPGAVSAWNNPGAGKVPNSSGTTSLIGGSSTPSAALPIVTGSTNLFHQATTVGNPVRRYQVQLALGIFNQEKLIPTKFMASQLAIEITLENAAACMYYQPSAHLATQPSPGTLWGDPSGTPPTYVVRNVNLIPEILEFDASYDESFLRGLQTGGVPIKFSTWNNYRFSNNGVSSINLQIQERSRSVKAIFCLQRRDPPSPNTDSGASFFNTAIGAPLVADAPSTFQEFQFRIGGR